jgi:iron(III) transport system ATP-binding protein
VPDLTLSGVTKSYGGQPVLDRLDLTVHDKEFVTLLGPSGCGKTTTLMAVAGFQHPDAGRITCGDEVFFDAPAGRSLAAEKRNLGIVFQSYAIWPHMTVAANVGFPLRLRKVKKADAARRVAEVLDLVELGGFGTRYPHQLSGGQQQRVALARALSFSPAVLLLDEPFSNLDAKLRERAREWVKQLQREIGVTTLFVTHDQEEALAMSDRVMVMSEGVILQVGTPEDIYRRPLSRFVADFVGTCNFLGAAVVGVGPDSVTVAIEGASAPVSVSTHRTLARGQRVTVAFRPESCHLGPDGIRPDDVTMTVTPIGESFLGDHYLYRAKFGVDELLVRADARVAQPSVEIGIAHRDIALVE